MKNLLAMTAVASMLASPAIAQDKHFSLEAGYLHEGGAILSYYNTESIVDPYFPTKAILIAQDSGMDVSKIGHDWINWLIARQESDGLFSRFCMNEDSGYHMACLVADADDSMMAMWIEMLYRLAPANGMPVSWRRSIHKAQVQLDDLYNDKLNVYHISKELPVGLLMDNLEIYASLKRAGKEARRLGDLRQSSVFYSKAARLKTGIMDTFWDAEKTRFRSSTQVREKEEFYPDYVVQLMPMLHGFHVRPMPAPDAVYAEWMKAHKEEWMSLIGKTYPWGLVAMASVQHKDMATAGCWIAKTAPHRHSTTWDVLDEAAFQSVELSLQRAGIEPTCNEVMS